MRACRDCGCTELDACVYVDAGTTFSCFWVEPDLCSFCALNLHIEEAQQRTDRVRQVRVRGGVL